MLTKPLSDAVEALAELNNQRVWSLLVTVFGDLAQNDGDVIEGPVLSVLMWGLHILNSILGEEYYLLKRYYRYQSKKI